MVKIYLDPGHGGTDTGASAGGVHEKDVVLSIALRARDILLNEYEGVEVRMSRTTDVFVSLADRANDANTWGADYFISIHANAFDSTSARGYEDYIHDSLSDSSLTAQRRDVLHPIVASATGIPNRGKKKANFQVLRETAMSAVLTENGFVTSPEDRALMLDESWLQAVGRAHAEAAAAIFNLQQQTNSNAVYRVIVDGTQVGAYGQKENILNEVRHHLGAADEILIQKV
ncbi:N-acetylmuramoyl-L-alanine amidase [Evansella caseinilytica]|uniref:N-acetylmuramoyl-L-alanine amidase n=1 Tax=Evansella caseinilytica TaxID=1503961 RepID=A0A1H3TMP1_9BACI|nr:N-acetylmuramoyl-L-alanine amidase [Evansella caseinilytica]SDZ51524.1 N-acetylmuramoyl-L-alanine amidase [Evansella caseinilytica]